MVLTSEQSICPLRIMCMVSIPAMMIRALQNDLNPNIARVIRLMAQWSCSTMLLTNLTMAARSASCVNRQSGGPSVTVLITAPVASTMGR